MRQQRTAGRLDHSGIAIEQHSDGGRFGAGRARRCQSRGDVATQSGATFGISSCKARLPLAPSFAVAWAACSASSPPSLMRSSSCGSAHSTPELPTAWMICNRSFASPSVKASQKRVR